MIVNVYLNGYLIEVNMLLLVIWKNLREKVKLKGYMCVCIIFEEKLKKIVINLKRNKFNYDKFKKYKII